MVKTNGFSLVELLVSLTILSLITLIANSAFMFFSQRWSGHLGDFDRKFEILRTRLMVNQAIEDIIPYVVKNPDGEPRLYFEGNINGFVAVSQNSITNPGYPSVIRLSIKLDENGLYFIIYEEWPMVTGVLSRTNDEIPFKNPLILHKGMDNIMFEYKGSIEENVEINNTALLNETNSWVNQFNSLNTMTQPEKLRVIFYKNDVQTVLHVDLIQPTGVITSLLDRETG